MTINKIEARLLDIPHMKYLDCLELMRGLVDIKRFGVGPEVLILVEHEPVLTLGRRAQDSDIVAPPAMLASAGVTTHRIERGGLITYHGPGQLVIYPVLQLKRVGIGVVDLVRTLEETVIQAVADEGLTASRDPDHPGVWVGQEKIASLGIAVRRGVSFHGLALNLDPDLSHFMLINPCGMPAERITSLKKLLGRSVDPADLRQRVKKNFSRLLRLDFMPWTVEDAWTCIETNRRNLAEPDS